MVTAGLPRAIKRHHGPSLGWVLGSADHVCREGQHARWVVSSQVSPGSQVSGAARGKADGDKDQESRFRSESSLWE